MYSRHMIIWVLVLLVGWVIAFNFFQKHFDGPHPERVQLKKALLRIRELERTIALREFSFQEYKDAVASSGLKVKDPNKLNKNLRAIASVTISPEFKKSIAIESAKNLFRKGLKFFKQNSWQEASEALSEFVEKYPDSPRLPEATYLKAEAFFHQKKFEETVKSIDFLVGHFPETEYSAYGLLRLAQIFEELERLEDAADVYQTVVREFKGTHAAVLANKLRIEREL